MRKTPVLLFAPFVLTAFAAAGAAAYDCDLDAYYEYGRKGSSGLVEEEDLTDEFDYSKYNFKFSQKLKDKSSYSIKYQYYHKDFDTLENLDNSFHYAGLGADLILRRDEAFQIKTLPDIELKKKTYEDSKNLDYNQLRIDLPIAFRKESDWTARFTGGINYYEYPDAPKDEFKLNFKIEVSKKLFGGNVEASAFYKFQFVEREKIANRFERNYGASVDTKVEWPLTKEIGAGFESGMDNTKIFEEREDAYDFRYDDWFLRTKHPVSENVRASLKYTNMSRNYADFNHDYGGFMIDNNWDFEIFDVKGTSCDLKFDYRHKQFRYPYVANPYDFHQNFVASEVQLSKRDDWKLIAADEIRFYNFPAKHSNDKIYYILRVSAEKFLFKKSVTAGFDYRYVFKNFLHKLDITENVFRGRLSCRW